jgi:hypothetical protein
LKISEDGPSDSESWGTPATRTETQGTVVGVHISIEVIWEPKLLSNPILSTICTVYLISMPDRVDGDNPRLTTNILNVRVVTLKPIIDK